MTRKVIAAITIITVGMLTAGGIAFATPTQPSPKQDLQAFQQYFKTRFPDVPFDKFVNGSYALNKNLRAQWEQLKQFPAYTFALQKGKELFNTPFSNGNTYANCFPNGGIGIRQNYPYFDTQSNEVITLALAVNRCRKKNGEKPLAYKTGDIAAILAYMAYTSRGNPLDIKIPDDPAAVAAYMAGKKFFYTRRGQLNFSCASCHVHEAGKRIRSQILTPALGILASFPIHRSKWGGMGTIDRRFIGCMRNVRAKALPPQSVQFRNLEYFLTYMSNGLPVAGPGLRP